MKIKRLCAANIREAMRKIREELGPEAVILSNQRTAAGFEVVAAIDYDEQTLQQATLDAAAKRRALVRETEAQFEECPDLEAPATATNRPSVDPVDPPVSAAPEDRRIAA